MNNENNNFDGYGFQMINNKYKMNNKYKLSLLDKIKNKFIDILQCLLVAIPVLMVFTWIGMIFTLFGVIIWAIIKFVHHFAG